MPQPSPLCANHMTMKAPLSSSWYSSADHVCIYKQGSSQKQHPQSNPGQLCGEEKLLIHKMTLKHQFAPLWTVTVGLRRGLIGTMRALAPGKPSLLPRLTEPSTQDLLSSTQDLFLHPQGWYQSLCYNHSETSGATGSLLFFLDRNTTHLLFNNISISLLYMHTTTKSLHTEN